MHYVPRPEPRHESKWIKLGGRNSHPSANRPPHHENAPTSYQPGVEATFANTSFNVAITIRGINQTVFDFEPVACSLGHVMIYWSNSFSRAPFEE